MPALNVALSPGTLIKPAAGNGRRRTIGRIGSERRPGNRVEALRTHVVIIGRALGACAATLAAARLGCRDIFTEVTHWVGDQLTNQAVSLDEHPWFEECEAGARYRKLKRETRNVGYPGLRLRATDGLARALSVRSS